MNKSEDTPQILETKVHPNGSSAGIILLQWLTYAFWGWTLLALVWLIYIVVASMTTSQDLSGVIPYAIAASLVLLPISVICDFFYGRHEPPRKVGAAMVVMVIHAVIFALFGIGMLISGVLTIVQMSIGSSSDNEFQSIWLWTAFLSTILYSLTFIRTLNPVPQLKLGRIFPFAMTVIVGLLIVLGFAGPVAKANLTRDDRQIMSSINGIRESVDRYVQANRQVPMSLYDTDLQGEERKLVERGLVSYKPEGEKKRSDDAGTDYRFQLCAVYTQTVGDPKTNYESPDEYVEYRYDFSHTPGTTCYKYHSSIYND